MVLAHTNLQLLQRWQEIKSDKPHLRRREHAKMLGSSEFELCAIDPHARFLKCSPMEFLLKLRELGECSLSLESPLIDLSLNVKFNSVLGNAREATVQCISEENGERTFNLQFRFERWHYIMALVEANPTHVQRWFQVFDASGECILKFIPHHINAESWAHLIESWELDPKEMAEPKLVRSHFIMHQKGSATKTNINQQECLNFFHEVARPGRLLQFQIEIHGQCLEWLSTLIASRAIWSHSILSGKRFYLSLQLENLHSIVQQQHKDSSSLRLKAPEKYGSISVSGL